MSVPIDLYIEECDKATGEMVSGQDMSYGDDTTAYLSSYTYPNSSIEDWPWSDQDGFVQAASSAWNIAQDHECLTPADSATSIQSLSPCVHSPKTEAIQTTSEKTAKQLRRKAQNRASQRNFRQRKEQNLREAHETITQLQNQSQDQQREIARLTGLLQQTRIEVQTLRSILTPRAAEVNGIANLCYDNTWIAGRT